MLKIGDNVLFYYLLKIIEKCRYFLVGKYCKDREIGFLMRICEV